MRIGVDIDGVIANLALQILSVANGEEFGLKVPEHPTDYHLGLSPEQMTAVVTYMVRRRLLFDGVRACSGASARLKEWRKLGHQAVYVTFRGVSSLGQAVPAELRYDLETQTEQWLYANDFVGPVHYVEDKLEFCRENEIPLLLEDCLEVAQCSLVQPNSPRVILIDQPWNQQDKTYPWRAKLLMHVEDLVPELKEPAVQLQMMEVGE